MTDSTADNDLALTSRRHVLQRGAMIGGAALAGGLAAGGDASATEADNLPPNVPEWMKVPGAPMGSQPYGTPSPFEKSVVKNISKNLPNIYQPRAARRCRISTASSRRTGCSMNATTVAFPQSILRSIV